MEVWKLDVKVGLSNLRFSKYYNNLYA